VVARPPQAGQATRFDPLSRAGWRRNDADIPIIDVSLPPVAANGNAVVLGPPPTIASPLVVVLAPPPAPAAPPSPPRAERHPRTNKRADPLAPHRYGGVSKRPPAERKRKPVDHHYDGNVDSEGDETLRSVVAKRRRHKTSGEARKRSKSKAKNKEREEEEGAKHPSKKQKKNKGAKAEAKSPKKGWKKGKQAEAPDQALLRAQTRGLLLPS
jgi:type IV secretory pathway VirB10-like protein